MLSLEGLPIWTLGISPAFIFLFSLCLIFWISCTIMQTIFVYRIARKFKCLSFMPESCDPELEAHMLDYKKSSNKKVGKPSVEDKEIVPEVTPDIITKDKKDES